MRSTLTCSTVAASGSGTSSGSVHGSSRAADGCGRTTTTAGEVVHAAAADAHAISVGSRMDLVDKGARFLRRRAEGDGLLDDQFVAQRLGGALGLHDLGLRRGPVGGAARDLGLVAAAIPQQAA